MKNLLASPKTKDHVAVAKAAHALKSMSVNVGASKLGAICAKIEYAAIAKAPFEELADKTNKAATCFKATRKEVPAMLERYTSKAA